MIDISIIVPVYNVEDYIIECLESVMAQTSDISMECLLIDDCGQDNSIALAESLIARYCEAGGKIFFRVVHRPVNGGLSAARNTGIREAKGRYLFFLDSDDFIAPDCMEQLYSEVILHPEVQIVTGDFQTIPQKDILRHISLADRDFPTYSSNIQWIRSIFLSALPIISCNKLYLRQWIIDNSLFFKEGILHEDNHWHALAYPYISSLAFVNRVTYFYRQRQDSIVNHQDAELRRIKNMYIICEEMFARHIQWDYSWAFWVYSFFEDLKMRCKKVGIKYNNVISLILKNSSAPLIVKLSWIYYKYSPIELGKYRLMLWSMRVAFK